MRTVFYDDPPLAPHPSIFLAGPTSRDGRTAWRIAALAQLARAGFAGAVLVPEFRDRAFADAAPYHFAGASCSVPEMRAVSYNVLAWETTGIESATVVLFWMPFHIADAADPASLPGFTTRAEVSRELVRAPHRIVLGMPAGALSSAHIRYHAHHAGVPILPTWTRPSRPRSPARRETRTHLPGRLRPSKQQKDGTHRLTTSVRALTLLFFGSCATPAEGRGSPEQDAGRRPRHASGASSWLRSMTARSQPRSSSPRSVNSTPSPTILVPCSTTRRTTPRASSGGPPSTRIVR